MIDGAGPFRILRSIIVPQSVAGDHRGRPVPLLLRLERLLRAAAVPRQQARAAAAVDRDPAVQRAVRDPADADPGVRVHDDGRADRRLPPRPAGVHARRRRDRGREVTDRAQRARATADRVAGDPGGRLAAGDRRPVPDGRPSPGRHVPMIDDGEFAGVPIGGLGTGSIGRTYRGDAARWHLEVGRHRVRAGRGRRRSRCSSAGRSGTPGDGPLGAAAGRAAGLGLDPARRRRDLSRPVPAGLADVRAGRRSGIRLVGEQLSPGHRRRPRVERAARRGLRVVGREPRARPADGRAPVHLGGSARRDPGAAPAPRRTRSPATPALGDRLRRRARPMHRPGCAGRSPSRRSARDGVSLAPAPRSTRSRDRELWADFAAGRAARPGTDDRAPDRRRRAATGAAVAATVELAPGERRSIRFALAWDLPIVEFGAGRRWWKRYTRDWGRTRRARVRPGPPRPRPRRRPGARAIEAWQAPILDDPERPDWYKAALFNELYFLVDGGTFWEAGEVGRAGARPPTTPGRFALLECVDYPFYDTRRRRLLRVVRDARAVPRARDARHPRPARGDPGRRPRDRHDRGVRRCRRRARSAGRSRTTSAAPPTTRSTGPTGTSSRTSTTGRTSGPKFVLQAWRDAVAAGRDRAATR